MYLITQFHDGSRTECEIDDFEIRTEGAGNANPDLPTRRRTAKAWLHSRGKSAMSHSKAIAEMLLAEIG